MSIPCLSATTLTLAAADIIAFRSGDALEPPSRPRSLFLRRSLSRPLDHLSLIYHRFESLPRHDLEELAAGANAEATVRSSQEKETSGLFPEHRIIQAGIIRGQVTTLWILSILALRRDAGKEHKMQ